MKFETKEELEGFDLGQDFEIIDLDVKVKNPLLELKP
jgi:hypothetical protein